VTPAGAQIADKWHCVRRVSNAAMRETNAAMCETNAAVGEANAAMQVLVIVGTLKLL
jgi:hypothetical protein